MIQELETELQRIVEPFGGVLGYALHYPDTGEIVLQHRGDEMFPTASVIKIAVMCAVMEKVERKEFDWALSVTVTPAHAGQREEGGPAFHFRNRSRLPLCEWLHLMICLSDNTATIVLRNLVGQGAINDWLFRHGFRVTRILNGAETDILGLREMQQEYGLGVTTPNEMAQLMTLIRNGKAGGRGACERMLRLLSMQYWDDFFLAPLPPLTPTANKTGAVDRSRSDVALIESPKGTYVLSAFTKKQEDTRWELDNAGDMALRAISRLVWQYHAPEHSWQPPSDAENYYPVGG